jgi:hypothetical protein
MIPMTELVTASPAARLRASMGSAWAYTRGQKQPVPSVVITGGFTVDHNSTSVSAALEHRWRP